MHLHSSSEIKFIEKYTVENSDQDYQSLVEKASSLFANWVDKKLLKDNMRIAVLCGWGNNGADGLTIGRILQERNELADIYFLDFGNKTELCEHAYKQVESKITIVKCVEDLKSLSEYNLVVDAIIGIGSNRPFSEELMPLIEYINSESRHIMSVDIPSGMLSDQLTEHKTIEADETMTFICPKKSFFAKDNERRLGKWIIRELPVEYDDSFYSNHILTKEILKDTLQDRKRFSHKGTYGHSLLIGGDYGMAGSVILAAQACQKIGSGLVTVGSCESNRTIIQQCSLESMFVSFGDNSISNFNQSLDRFDIIGIGPGLGQNAQTIDGLSEFLKTYEYPLVLDADALNIIARMQLEEFIPHNSILTPHPKEFDRIFGEHSNEMDRVRTQRAMSEQLNCFIILKDAYTSVTTPSGELFYSLTGNPGMATGGSGDVLTGVLTGLIAQKYSIHDSCLLAVYLHGYAGDLASKNIGEMSMSSRDIIAHLPASIRALRI